MAAVARPSTHGQSVTVTPAGPVRIEELFRNYVQFVARVLRRHGVRDGDLDDAVQEVFMTVAAKLDQYEERGALRAWLFTIARQTANHARRSTERRLARESAQPSVPPHPPTPEDETRRRQAAALVQRFLESLPEEQATTFYLAEVEGLSVPEIAACDGTNVNTVYARLRLSRGRFHDFVRALNPIGTR